MNGSSLFAVIGALMMVFGGGALGRAIGDDGLSGLSVPVFAVGIIMIAVARQQRLSARVAALEAALALPSADARS